MGFFTLTNRIHPDSGVRHDRNGLVLAHGVGAEHGATGVRKHQMDLVFKADVFRVVGGHLTFEGHDSETILEADGLVEQVLAGVHIRNGISAKQTKNESLLVFFSVIFQRQITSMPKGLSPFHPDQGLQKIQPRYPCQSNLLNIYYLKIK